MNLRRQNIQKSFCEKADALRFESLYREAIANYLNAILIDRNSAECYFGLGVCYKHLKDYAKAIKYLELATQKRESYYDAYFELGICHQLEGIACGAIKNFICAIQIDPENLEAILQLGVSHEICEENDLALMIYQKLIENSPEFEKAYDYKSALLMKMSKYKEASKILYELIKLNPEYSKAYAGIGVCLEKLGRPLQAKRYYRKFLTLNPFSEQTSFVKERMEKLQRR